MKHYLITPAKAMSSRWQRAFPNGVVLVDDEVEIDQPAIVWLDLSARTALQKEQLLRRVISPQATVIALSTVPDKQEAMSVIRLGCKGYGHLMAAPEQFRQMAAVVVNGGYWLGQDLASDVVQVAVAAASEPEASADNGRNLLTDRECEVADEVAHGASNREIAERLAISERTVKAHLSVIFEKLQLRDRVQLALKLNGVAI
jgi:DNA-binding NarL/FixJ family response regulator